MTVGAFAYSRKSVAKLILHKGGKSVYVETFGLLGLGKKDKVDLKNVRFYNYRGATIFRRYFIVSLPVCFQMTCTVSRLASRGYIPLRRTDRRSFFANYIIDIHAGRFPDPFLFDMTAGLQRVFTKAK